ncbi:hypothetical protein V8B97DRAFT_2021401 [Scleroderma yunnanense]
MAPCQVCDKLNSKYTCSTCKATRYLTIDLETCTSSSRVKSSAPSTSGAVPPTDPTSDTLEDPSPLRALTSLNWPYIPDDSTYDDPLKRDDPKPLKLHQYEAIATSPTIRSLLASNPHLRTLLTNIDSLRGAEREEALQRALGVDGKQLRNERNWQIRNDDVAVQEHEIEQHTRAFRMLAGAVEAAVRGGKEDMLGLDWDDQ